MTTAEEAFPELYDLAKEIAKDTLVKINETAPGVQSGCIYKCQCVLELVISELEKSV